MDREQHLPYRAIGDVAVLEGDGSRLEREDVFPCLSWAEGIPAPVDADGNVVPLTTRTLYDGDGHEISVMEYALIYSEHTGVPVWRVRRSDGMIFMLSLLHLARPDTWERVEADIMAMAHEDCVCYYFGVDADTPCSACPSVKIKGSCPVNVARDVFRRAKALAERDAKGADRD